MLRTSNRNAPMAIARREPFTTGTGSLRGLSSGDSFGYGYLPDEDRKALDDELPWIDYVVMSYETPIGWHHNDGTWTIPEVKYSATTSKHQGILRRAV